VCMNLPAKGKREKSNSAAKNSSFRPTFIEFWPARKSHRGNEDQIICDASGCASSEGC
jgi:hypothetical protein